MGFCTVFCILAILIGVITAFGHIMAPRVKKQPLPHETPSESRLKDRGEHIPALDSAAIAAALHLFADDAHDKESYMLKIKKVQRMYSPWNSKIYGLNNLNK